MQKADAEDVAKKSASDATHRIKHPVASSFEPCPFVKAPCLPNPIARNVSKDGDHDKDFIANSGHKHEILGFRFNICGLLRQLLGSFSLPVFVVVAACLLM